jgi:hypothetical protein
MSRENVEVVRRALEVFNEGGLEAVVSGGFYSPEVVFDPSPTGVPGLGVYRGYDEIRAFFEEDWFRAFPFEEWEGRGADRQRGSGDRHVPPAGSGREQRGGGGA